MGAKQNANGGWLWADNSMMNYSAWWLDQPNIALNEAVGAMQTNQNWRWSAVASTATQFIAGYIWSAKVPILIPAYLAVL